MSFTGFPVVFASAPSQECVDIVIVDDNDLEQNEFFEVEIDSPQADSAVSIGLLNRTTVLIVDNGEPSYVIGNCTHIITACTTVLHPHIDDVSCGIALTSVTYMAIEGEGFASVCVQLFGQTPVDVSVQLNTVTGSGTATGTKTL